MDIAFNDTSGTVPPVIAQVGAPDPKRRAEAAWQRARSQIIIIVTIGLCVVLLVWAIMYVVIDTESSAAIQHAKSEGSNLSAAFQDEVSQKLTSVAHAMDAVAEHMRAANGNFDISVWAKEIPLLSDAMLQAAIIGPDGRLLSTTLEPHAAPIDLSDREHFRVHLDGAFRGLFISKPMIGRVSGKQVIQVTRRVDDADGRFLGVIVFSMVPGQLTNLHNAINLGPRDKLIVIGTVDQVIRARFGAGREAGDPGTGLPVPAPPEAVDGRGPILCFFRESVLDHVTRLHNIRYLKDFPLRVDVALDLAEILRPAQAHAKLIKALGIIATLMLTGLMIMLTIETRRRTDREVTLWDEQDRLAAEIRLEAEAREKLRASEARLRDFAEMASDWFWEMDADLRFVETRFDGPPLTGGDPFNFGKRPWDMFDTSLAPERWASLRLDLLARRPFRDFRHSRLVPGGKTRHFSINGVPTYGAGGVFLGYRGTGRDITAKVEAEMALRRSKDDAEASSVAKSAFLANMSHELRTPLNAIIGFAELIHGRKTGRITDDYVEWAGDILSSGRHLLDLINDVLELSRIDAGRYDIVEETVDLGLTVRSCLPMIRRQAETNRVRIEYAIAEKSAIVRADKRAIKQVVLNLLTNAVKFTPGGGLVSIRADTGPAGEMSLVVADTGIGIDPSTLSKLCQPFVQADASTSRKYGGTGLGLAISTKIMNLHDGSLTIASALGEGTSVWVSFPAARVLAEKRQVESTA